MATENVIIGFFDWTDSIQSWSGGSWKANFPASNAGDSEMARVARSTDLNQSSLTLIGTLDKEYPIKVFGTVLPNASTQAEMQIILRDKNGSQVADSGFFEVFPPVYPSDELAWEDDNWWTGKYRDEELKNTLWTRPYRFDDIKRAKEFEMNFKDANNADGYLEVAFVTVSSEWQLGLNPAPGAEYGFAGARTRTIQARGGAKTFDRLPKPNTFRGTVEFMDRDEALSGKFELDRQHDLDKPFLWWPFPDRPKDWLRTVFIARNRGISRLRHPIAPMNFLEVPINVEQVL